MLLDAPAWLTYGLAVLASVLLMPTRPAIVSVLPAVATTTDQLTAANVTVGLVETCGQLLGPLLAGFVLGFGAPGHVLVVLGVLGLLGAAATMGAVDPVAATHIDDPPRETTLRELIRGFRVCIEDARVRALVILVSTIGLVVGAVDVGVTTLAIEILGRGESTVSLLGGAYGMGTLLGAASSLLLVGRRRLALGTASGVLASCAVFALVGWSGSVALTVAMLVATGAGSTLAGVAARTMLQGLTSDDTLARLFGVIEALFYSFIAAGGALLSFSALRLGATSSFAVVGGVSAIVLLAVLPRLLAIDAARRELDPDVVELARSSSIFGPLPPYAIEQIMHRLIPESFPAGALILKKGDVGDRMLLVDQGDVVVGVVGTPPIRLGRGTHLGEISILRNAPRNADVHAGPDGASVYWLDGAAFLDAVDRVPRSRARVEAEADRRIAPR
jgi:hypothetical protein